MDSTTYPATCILTSSQKRVSDRITAFAETHFSATSWNGPIDPQTNILIAGPTGTGKSFSVKRAAQRAVAKYAQVTHGSWIPIGAGDTMPTMCRIGMLLLQSDRLILHVDELDKFQGATESWAKACQNDLFQILDKKINWEPVVAHRRFIRKVNSAACDAAEIAILLERAVERGLMIVGSGTWQQLFDEDRQPLGFNVAPTTHDALDRRSKIEGLSPELKRRFHLKIQYLDYPDLAETAYLLDAFGFSACARRIDFPLAPESINWTKMGGMTALTSLRTDLLIATREFGLNQPTELLPHLVRI